jgi:hypothetical protein
VLLPPLDTLDSDCANPRIEQAVLVTLPAANPAKTGYSL